MKYLKKNIKTLEKHTKPVLYLFSDAWKIALSLDLSDFALFIDLMDVARVYYEINTLNQQYKAREVLEDSQRTDLLDNDLKERSESLLDEIRGVYDKLFRNKITSLISESTKTTF
jgi:hypothetical protein